MTYEEICQEEYNKIDFNRSCAGVAIQNAIERIGKKYFNEKLNFANSNLNYDGCPILSIQMYACGTNKFEIWFWTYEIKNTHEMYSNTKTKAGQRMSFMHSYKIVPVNHKASLNWMDMMELIRQLTIDFDLKVKRINELNKEIIKFIQIKEIGINDGVFSDLQ